MRGGAVVQPADIKARVARLDELSRGLVKEGMLQRGVQDVLLYRERQQYLAAVRHALSGVEAARVTLAKAVRRLEGG
jgi:hypothetical protein